MKSKVAPLFGKFIVDNLINDATVKSNSYIGIGRNILFGSNDANVSNVVFSTNDNYSVYKNLVGLKKILAADVQSVIPRVDWTANTVYDRYTDHDDLYSFDDITDLGTVDAYANVVLGTANISASNIVFGNGTSFTSYVFSGDQIVMNSETKTVVSVTNNIHLIVNSAFTNSNTNGEIKLLANSTVITANLASFSSNLYAGNLILVGDQTRQVIAVRSDKVITVNTALSYSNSNIGLTRHDNTYPYLANTYYVRNIRDQVFKCINNNNRANSVIEPTIDIGGQLPESPFILTNDGYKWKYLYTIPPGLKGKFFTPKWMPVVKDNAVVLSSVYGRIDSVDVLWGGSGYLAGGNSNSSSILSITETDGVGANLVCSVANGVITKVTVLTGGNNYSTGIVTINDPSHLGSATIGGTVNVSGIYVTANLSNTANQSFVSNVLVNDIVTVNSQSRNVVSVTNGSFFTVNSAFTAANNQTLTLQRSDSQFDIQFPPITGGHGSDPAAELGARTLMFSVELEGTENDSLPVSDENNVFKYNQIAMIREPLLANGAYSGNTNLRATTRLFVSDPGIINFIDGETVYIGATLAAASMIANVANWDATNNYLYINNISGVPGSTQIIKGDSSGCVSTILGIANSDIKIYSGDLMYVENRKEISRSSNQIDQIKIILTF